MKRLLALLLTVMMLGQALPAGAAPAAKRPNSDPIAEGTINKVTYIYWGKGEMFPVLALVGPGKKLDVYEYDKNWVMVLYDTWVSQGYSGSAQSFYGYVKRADITCDPELTGDESAKADTGPGKRKGKKPKPQPTAGASAEPTAPQESAGESAEPEPTVETVDDEEYDWIIRTPGMCNVTIQYQQATITCSFALMAQKAGGTAPSSDPAFNHGMHTPYAAMGAYSMVAPMQSIIENMGEASQFLQGSGGVEIIAQTAGAQFFLDTGAMDPALVNFTINMDAVATLNPKVTDGNITGQYEQTINMPYTLPVQLKKAGGGYKFVLVGMKPGGGNLEFPAVLEKAFADPDRWDKEAKNADKRREEAEKLRKKMLEKLKKQMQDEYKKQQEDKTKADSESTDPMTVPGENGEDIPLAPLVTEDPLAPLVTVEPLATLGTVEPLATLGTEEPLATLGTEEPLWPLTPQNGEEVNGFPSGK